MPNAVIGKTDLWTTSPDVASMLLDKDIGYQVTSGSHKKADFICPNCGTIVHDKIIRKACTDGLRCPVCTDGISYPEKLMSCLLNELDVNYVRDSGTGWSGKKRYDFYIKEMSMIIETHGMQHYDDSRAMFSKRVKRDELDNDEYKKELAISNGIQHYIEIDCRWSSFDYIYDSIMSSDMTDLFDLSRVDWERVEVEALRSEIIRVCDAYNGGITDIEQLASMFNLDRSTVRDYLERAKEAGLCDYHPKVKEKAVICVDTGKIYNAIKDVAQDGFNASQVSACCNNYEHVHTSGGYNWCFLDEYNPETYVMKRYAEKGIPKKVKWIETGKIYDRLTDVKYDGFSPSAVSKVCRKAAKRHKGQHFEFV